MDDLTTNTCPSCHAKWSLSKSKPHVKFCPFCHTQLNVQENSIGSLTHLQDESISIIQEHLPQEVEFSIGPYQILKKIGTGGMGEVYLAYDTTCGRRIALKRIRTDLSTHAPLTQRFLREARITAQLTHPAIIPIYEIHSEEHLLYYTMPYVEGKTLKDILAEARHNEKKGIKQDHVESIPALIRIFLNICQSIAYAHSKDVLHRDIKPNNIIIGKYGEVLILDWGLAKLMSHSEQEKNESIGEEVLRRLEVEPNEITQFGKVVGTISYMAPERVLGQPATRQTDIYSLGVILYQILTLRYPFHRKTLQEFRKNIGKEILHDPAEVAPYRDVPPILSRITLKCLAMQLDQRYHTVDELINDIESYIEGRSEWFETNWLDIQRKEDWEFQENVLLPEHMLLNKQSESSIWVNLMISKASFTGNIRIEATAKLGKGSQGIGFLLSVPEQSERRDLSSGYCLWIGSDINRTTKLLRSSVEVVEASEVFLKRDELVQIRIEKIEHNIYFFLDDRFQFSYISHLPLHGSHIGFLAQDADFEIKNFQVSIGSQSLTVNCLSIPDAFLHNKDFSKAYKEYTKISYSFPGTAEGREAMFRAGLSLLEWAKNEKNMEIRQKKIEEAFQEFGKLHGTAGAPLEYLGKALLYQLQHDPEEEIKCFELAFRRYKNHPLLSILQEQMIHRMYESSHQNRKTTYHFTLIATLFMPHYLKTSSGEQLFRNLKAYWEPLPFILDDAEDYFSLMISLSFWLSKGYLIEELIVRMLEKETRPLLSLKNAIFALFKLNEHEKALHYLEQLKDCEHEFNLIKNCFTDPENVINDLPSQIVLEDERVIIALLDTHMRRKEIERLQELKLSPFLKLQVDAALIRILLYEKKWEEAGVMLHHFSLEQLMQENTPIYFLYGCWLCATEGKEIALAHFSSLLDTPYPRVNNLFAYFSTRKDEELQSWRKFLSFDYEKQKLDEQTKLFTQMLNEDERKTGH